MTPLYPEQDFVDARLAHALGMQHFADQDDWEEIKNRRRYRNDEAQELLRHLEDPRAKTGGPLFPFNYVNDTTAKWIPWLVEQVRKGDLRFNGERQDDVYPGDRNKSLWYGEEGYPSELDPWAWQHWADWLNSNHGTRRGFNPNEHGLSELVQGVENWDEALREEASEAEKAQHRQDGHTLWQDDEGWTVRSLNADEAKREGKLMDHCVGDYGHRISDGTLRVLSLRDPAGKAHSTTGVHFDFFSPHFGVTDPHLIEPDNFEGGQIWQHYGKGNSQVKPEYNERLRQFFHSLPERQRPASENGEMYIDNIYELEHLVNGAYDNDHDELGLSNSFDPIKNVDWERVFTSTLDRGYRDVIYYPQYGKTLYNFAKQHGAIPQLAQIVEEQEAKDWDDRDYWDLPSPTYSDSPYTYTPMPDPYNMDDEKDVEAYNRLQNEHGMQPEQVESAAQIPQDWHEWYERHHENLQNDIQQYYLDQDPNYQRTDHFRDLLAPHWNQSQQKYVNVPEQQTVTAGLADFSGWEPGQRGKGFIDPEGGVQHWVTDSHGNPHHMMMAGEDENPDMYKRFDILPDGRVIDIVDHLSQRFDHDDWQKVLNSHPDFYAADEAAEQGFGHADAIMDSLHKREGAMQNIEESMRWAVERYGSSSTRKLIEQAEGLPPDRTRIVHDFGDGWKVVEPTTVGDVHRTGELMSNCWSASENEWMYDRLIDREPRLQELAEENSRIRRQIEDFGGWERRHDPEFAPFRQALDENLRKTDQELNRHMHEPYTGSERMLHDPYGIPRVAWFHTFSRPSEILGRHNAVPKKQYWDMLEQIYPGVTPEINQCGNSDCRYMRTPESDATIKRQQQSVMTPEYEAAFDDPSYCPSCGSDRSIYLGK